MKIPLRFCAVCGLAAVAVGCASTEPAAPAAPDPALNPLGVPEVAPEDAESLIPPVLAEERAAIAGRPFAMPENYDLGGDARVIVGSDPDACATGSTEPVPVTAALNQAIRDELGRLSGSTVRAASADEPGLCSHLLGWTATLVKTGDGYRCDVAVSVSEVASKTVVLRETFSESVAVPSASADVPALPLRRLGARVALRIADCAARMTPFAGKIAACEDWDLLVMEGGSLQGVYEGQQMLVYATVDGVALPLAYADAKPGTTRTNLAPWKFNEADPLAKTVIEAIDDDPGTFAKYGLRAIAVGNPLPPIRRQRLAQ